MSVHAWLRAIRRALWDPVCPGCGEVGDDGLCARCAAQVDWTASDDRAPLAEVDGSPVFAAARLTPWLKRQVYGHKFDRRPGAAGCLQAVAARLWEGVDASAGGRLLWVPPRGSADWDPVGQWARPLAEAVGATPGRLRWTRETARQHDLSHRAARWQNLAGALAAERPSQDEGGPWWVVDDLWTTGATMTAALSALHAAGVPPSRVKGFVLATVERSPLSNPRAL